MSTRTDAGARPEKGVARPVSKPGDRFEREAEQAAQEVARGGSVSGYSFSAVPTSAPDPVQRDEAAKPKSDEEKKKEADDKNTKEALKKAGEAALETPQGKAVKEKVLADPLVKKVVDAATSPAGLVTAGAALAGGVTALAATGKELPVQPPEIPLEKLSSKLAGVSAKVTWEGPVASPTNVGLTITIREQGKGKSKKTDPIAADIARLNAQRAMFRSENEKAAEKAQEDEMVKAWLSQQRGSAFTIPVPLPPAKKDEPAAPAQPAPAAPSAAPPAHANVDAALSAPGRPLDPSARRKMEARFGYDFSGVRVHDDARAAATAAGIDAAAFTVGEDVVFGTGRYDPTGQEGRRLLAHELAHVVQQSGGEGEGRAVDVPAGGRPLDPELRDYFEPRLDLDLGGVTVHDGGEAAASARQLGAKAYTVGSDVVFAGGQYRPETPRGRWLLGHELAHVAQASEGGAVDGTPAVERDASDAATSALQGRPARVGARRDAGAVHLFGEPDNVPDLTFVSNSGTAGFLNQATAYHRTWGLAPQRFNSLQGLLAALAADTGTIGRLRIVSHANYDNIFTPLFDGGAAGITEQDLLAWGESDVAGLRRTLQAPLVTGPLRAAVLTTAEAGNPAIFASFGIDPANAPATGPLGQLLDASVDLIVVQSATGMPAAQKARFAAALTAELDGLRAQVQRPGGGTAATPAQVQELQDAITGVIGIGVDIPAQDAGVMRSITAATGGVTHGFRANLDAVRARLTAASWVDIRGCRVGQRPAYLAAVATFFGGSSGQPHVSGPDLWQSFPRLGWHSIPETGLTRKAAEANVQTALDHWADVTGARSRLAWWLTFLHRVLRDEALRSLEQTQSLLRPPSLLGGLTVQADPLMLDFGTGVPPLPELRGPTFGAGLGYQPAGPSLGTGIDLSNPLVPVAERDIARYSGPDGLFRYYMDVGLPLPVQEGADVRSLYLVFKVGRERDAIDAWTGSEWASAAPGLAAVQSGSWSRDAIRQVEAVENEDAQGVTTEMYVSPDPRYAAHIEKTS